LGCQTYKPKFLDVRTPTTPLDHITDVLIGHQWWRVPDNIKYKMAVLHYISFDTRTTRPCHWCAW